MHEDGLEDPLKSLWEQLKGLSKQVPIRLQSSVADDARDRKGRLDKALAIFHSTIQDLLASVSTSVAVTSGAHNAGLTDDDGKGTQAQSVAVRIAPSASEQVSGVSLVASERCEKLSSLLQQMRAFNSRLSKNDIGTRAGVTMAIDDVANAAAEREARAEELQKRLAEEGDEEHLFVEDEKDTFSRHPLPLLSGKEEDLQALVSSAKVVVIIFGGQTGQAEEHGGVSRPDKLSRALWTSPGAEGESDDASVAMARAEDEELVDEYHATHTSFSFYDPTEWCLDGSSSASSGLDPRTSSCCAFGKCH